MNWIGEVPASCQVSGRPLTDAFVDGRMRRGGRWAIMHPDCHAEEGVGLGTGRGQLYRRAGDRWEKAEG